MAVLRALHAFVSRSGALQTKGGTVVSGAVFEGAISIATAFDPMPLNVPRCYVRSEITLEGLTVPDKLYTSAEAGRGPRVTRLLTEEVQGSVDLTSGRPVCIYSTEICNLSSRVLNILLCPGKLIESRSLQDPRPPMKDGSLSNPFDLLAMWHYFRCLHFYEKRFCLKKIDRLSSRSSFTHRRRWRRSL